MHASEHEARYEARREAASIVVIAVGLLVALSAVSWDQGWELLGLRWWAWLVLAVPGLLLCADLLLGARKVGIAGTRAAALALLGLIVLGNLVGVVGALVTTRSEDLGGVQLLVTAGTIWAVTSSSSVSATGTWTTEGRSSAPATSARSRTSASRRTRRRRSLPPTGIHESGTTCSSP